MMMVGNKKSIQSLRDMGDEGTQWPLGGIAMLSLRNSYIDTTSIHLCKLAEVSTVKKRRVNHRFSAARW